MIRVQRLSRGQIALVAATGVVAVVAAAMFAPSQAPPQPAEPAVVEAPVVQEPVAPAAPDVAEPAEPEEAPEAEPWTVAAPLPGPELEVVRAGVGILDDEDAEPREIAEAEQAPVAPGQRVIVPGRGMGVLTWSDAMRGELLRGVAVDIDESALDERRVALNQEGGTVRYLLSPPADEGPVGLEVQAGAVTIESDTAGGEGVDLMITHTPTEDEDVETTWVVVVGGAAKVDFGSPVASAGEASAPPGTLRLETGQGAAFTRAAESPTVMPMDLVAVETWYGQMLSGYKDSIAAYAYRCVVTGQDVTLHELPPAGQLQAARRAANRVLSRVAEGTVLAVTHRTVDGAWLEATPPGAEKAGWVSADQLRCMAPLAAVPEADELYLSPATPTPVVVSASFAPAETEITAGSCTMLRWDVPSGSQIVVDGTAMPGKGFRNICPEVTTSYTLRWQDANGRSRERTVTIVVNEAPEQVAMAHDEDDGGESGTSSLLDPDVAEPEPTICVGPECEVVLPNDPLPTRTRRPRPTSEPTEPPAPTDPPAATEPPSEPDPTEPPSDPDPADTPTLTATATLSATLTPTAAVSPTVAVSPTSTVTPTMEPPTATPESPAPSATPPPPSSTPTTEPPPASPTATSEPPPPAPTATPGTRWQTAPTL